MQSFQKIYLKEIVTYLINKKEIAKLEFKIKMMKKNLMQENQKTIEKLQNLKHQNQEISKKIIAKNFEIIIPCKIIINDYDLKIEKKNMNEIEQALLNKNGELYDILIKRAAIVKHNIENVNEIALLSILMNKMKNKGSYEKLKNAIEYDAPFKELGIWLADMKKEEIDKLIYCLNRLDYNAYVDQNMLHGNQEQNETINYLKEKKIILQNKKNLWIPTEKINEFEENKKELDKLGLKMQIKLAKKNLYKYEEAEEEDFFNMQKIYMEKLAKHNAFIAMYEENEDEFF